MCVFDEQLAPDLWRCRACGVTARRPDVRVICRAGASVDVPQRLPPCEPCGPSLARKAWNFAFAVAQYVADGCVDVSAEDYAARLQVCATCDRRDPISTTCRECGCSVTTKAKGRAWTCPLGKWASAELSP